MPMNPSVKKFRYCKIKSPLGGLFAVSNSKQLTALVFESGWKDFIAAEKIELLKMKDSVLKETEKQLHEYFTGHRTEFDLPLEFIGTDFQKHVWRSLLSIPFGTTISYSEQAKRIKKPEAVRAVGGANGKNKICIIVPCHRVVGKNGSLTGFAGGIQAKEKLLRLEKIIL